MEPGSHVVVIGAGGNIGSHLIPHLTRIAALGRLTLVDRGVYEPRNLQNQDIPSGGSRRRKAVVQAARARKLNPRLQVDTVAEELETIPLGALRADLLLACLDSRRARQRVNDAASRLGLPWLDGGVLGAGLLGRVTRYVPGQELPCLECTWGEADYAALEQSYPCETAEPAATTAPSSLGALVAALLALECHKLLSGEGTPLAPGTELVVDAAHHRHFVTAVRRNPECRRADHGAWSLEPLPGGRLARLGSVFEAARRRVRGNGDLRLRVEGKPFVRELSCSACGATRRLLRLAVALRESELRCSDCGARCIPAGFGLSESIAEHSLTRAERNRPLAALGARAGEVLSIGTAERELHLTLVEP
ncbi:MAG TPA: ThiF family adenylyltransferase [Gemmatimonadales bacterium]|jgi:molybdopterin/thiamine biosynthesis adenylyltransferase|nr:ThiF family adenylyltransferase [Gemmatimonadales bacterium]